MSRGLEEVLSSERDVEVIDEARHDEEAVKLARETKPDVVMLNAEEPSAVEPKAVERMREASPPSGLVVVVTQDGSLRSVQELLAQGSGNLTMNIPPLNQDGGERCVNVLITRARRACRVFTHLTADDIDLNKSPALGGRALKIFLQYAQSGELDIPETTGRDPNSPFEEAVLSAPQREGYEVHT